MTPLASFQSGVVGLAKFRPSPGRIIMPDVTCNIIWVGGRLLFSGPATRARGSRLINLEVCLAAIEPWAARAWLQVPLHNLVDRTVPLADLDERLSKSFTEIFRFDRASDLFHIDACRRDVAEDCGMAVAASILRQGGAVSEAAMSLGLSERQFERLFKDRSGLTPRAFVQIARFRRAIGSAQQDQALAVAALTSGYVDQPHFNRATRALTGRTPRTLLPHVGNVQDVLSGEW